MLRLNSINTLSPIALRMAKTLGVLAAEGNRVSIANLISKSKTLQNKLTLFCNHLYFIYTSTEINCCARSFFYKALLNDSISSKKGFNCKNILIPCVVNPLYS